MPWRRLLGYLRPHWLAFSGAVVALLISTGAGLLLPLAVGQLVGAVEPGGDPGALDRSPDGPTRTRRTRPQPSRPRRGSHAGCRCYGVPMFELLVATITGLYLAGNQGGNDSIGNLIVTVVFWTAIATFARRLG